MSLRLIIQPEIQLPTLKGKTSFTTFVIVELPRVQKLTNTNDKIC